MILRNKLLLIVFTVSFYLINYCNGDISTENENNESDEDDKLKQALILVDLLKTGNFYYCIRTITICNVGAFVHM